MFTLSFAVRMTILSVDHFPGAQGHLADWLARMHHGIDAFLARTRKSISTGLWTASPLPQGLFHFAGFVARRPTTPNASASLTKSGAYVMSVWGSVFHKSSCHWRTMPR